MRAVYICEACGNWWEGQDHSLGLKCGTCGDRVYPVGTHHPGREGYDPEDHDEHSSSSGFDR